MALRRYVNTAACISRISYIDGDKGILRYRGYPIEELAQRSTYTEAHPLSLLPASSCIPHSTTHLRTNNVDGTSFNKAHETQHCQHLVSSGNSLGLSGLLSIPSSLQQQSITAEAHHPTQVSYLLQYGELPSRQELQRWDEALRRHSALPVFVENAVAALPHDAHFMGTILTAINALSTGHPEQNPALAGQDIYKSKEIQDKQIVRLIGTCLFICPVAT